MVSDNTNPTFSNSLTIAGTTRWMSPELLDPDQFGLKATLPTRKSDCYALGMVIYEVLSGNVPFAAYGVVSVIQKITIGGRPERPQGTEGAWFVDCLWDTLRLCWAHQPDGRPAIQDVLECLERVSRALKPPSSADDNADDLPLAGTDPVARHSPPLARIETEEPPTGVLVPCCVDGQPCHTSSCPRRVSTIQDPGDVTVYSGDFYCVIRDNPRQSCRCLRSRHRPQGWCVPCGCTLSPVE